MSNLTHKPFYRSTVLQVVVLTYELPAALLYMVGEIKADALLTVLSIGMTAFLGKEVIAKGSEAYRDKEN